MARSRVPAKTLDRLLVDVKNATPQCADCSIGPVVETRPDASGCNWTVSRIEGPHASDCLLAIADFIVDMRQNFLVERSEGDDPTLLTTWATENPYHPSGGEASPAASAKLDTAHAGPGSPDDGAPRPSRSLR